MQALYQGKSLSEGAAAFRLLNEAQKIEAASAAGLPNHSS
jgi:hypothetical protein